MKTPMHLETTGTLKSYRNNITQNMDCRQWSPGRVQTELLFAITDLNDIDYKILVKHCLERNYIPKTLIPNFDVELNIVTYIHKGQTLTLDQSN